MPNSPDKMQFYGRLLNQLDALIADEPDFIANMANLSALLYMKMPSVSWVGFYLYRGQQLVVGPFQGKPACIRIDMGKGVCGKAASLRESQLVDDVHRFPGHIACDSDSNSELVIPLLKGGQLLGVLDLDSPSYGRFGQQDLQGLQAIVERLLRNVDVS